MSSSGTIRHRTKVRFQRPPWTTAPVARRSFAQFREGRILGQKNGPIEVRKQETVVVAHGTLHLLLDDETEHSTTSKDSCTDDKHFCGDANRA